MSVPVLLPTGTKNESYGGVVYHIEGELVPVLAIEVSSVPVFFEHHILLWKDPSVNAAVKSLKGAFKRAMAGMPIFMVESSGTGRIAFSRDGPGHVFAKHLEPGSDLDVREHQFLAATSSLTYDFTMVKGVANVLFGGTGLFIDTFAATSQPGIVWLHGYGNVFEINLQPGEAIDIEPGGWIYKDKSVKMDTQFQKLSTGLFGSSGQLMWNRFTGPGRVGLQSMSYFPPTNSDGK